MQKILVAEDSFALANLLEFVLKNAGFDIEVHRNGSAAYEAATKQVFDLILVDQQMPKMTGVEVVEKLRGGGPNEQTPIVLCTAKTHELDLDFIQNTLGVTAVFEKPFSPKDLVEKLKSVLCPELVK